MRYLPISLLLLSLALSGCKNEELIQRGDPINVAFDKSLALYEKGKWADAAYGFDLVTRMGRGTNYATEAQYYLAESYYNDRQYILAASEYERFISYYPLDPKREEVEYKLAMCYYQQSPRYRLDQSATRRAIELFQLYNNKYPNSERVTEAAARIDELRNKLARKDYEAAEYYLRVRSYKAATIYFDLVIDQYPESKWAEEALVKQIETYITYADNSVDERQAERYAEAIATYEKYLQLFPQGKHRSKVEALYNEASKKLAAAQAMASSLPKEN